MISNAKKKKVEIKWKTLSDEEKQRFHEAKKKELDAWLKNNVLEIVSRKGISRSRIMRMRWF